MSSSYQTDSYEVERANAAALAEQRERAAQQAREALEAQRLARLEAAVERFRVAAPDTGDVYRRAADARAHQEALGELLDRAQQGARDARRDVDGARAECRDGFQAVLATADRAEAALRAQVQDLGAEIGALQRADAESAAAAGQDLRRVLAADTQELNSRDAVRARHLAHASECVAQLEQERARVTLLGLDVAGLRSELGAATLVQGDEGLVAARRVVASAERAVVEIHTKAARIDATRDVLKVECAVVRAQIAGLDPDMVDGLDRPILAELARVERGAAALARWHDHEDALRGLRAHLGEVRVAADSLCSQVVDFDRLDEARIRTFDAVPAALQVAFGEPVRLVREVVSAPLLPEIRYFETPLGKKADVTVHLDGTLRLHIEDPASRGDCAATIGRVQVAVAHITRAGAGAMRIDAAPPALPVVATPNTTRTSR